jgi:hypothetical protein
MVAEDAKIENSLNLHFFYLLKSEKKKCPSTVNTTYAGVRAGSGAGVGAGAVIRIYGSPKEIFTAPQRPQGSDYKLCSSGAWRVQCGHQVQRSAHPGLSLQGLHSAPVRPC